MANRNMQAKINKIRKQKFKRRIYSYDPTSPVALRTRGSNAIDLGSMVPETWEFGRRGLIMARATGPTAVAKHISNDAHDPTMIPRVAVIVQRNVLMQYDETAAGDKFRTFHCQTCLRRPEYTIYMWFNGDEFIFEKRMNEPRISYRSIVYNSEQGKRRQRSLHLICWVHKPIRYPSG